MWDGLNTPGRPNFRRIMNGCLAMFVQIGTPRDASATRPWVRTMKSTTAAMMMSPRDDS